MERALNPHMAPEAPDGDLDQHEYTHWRDYLRSLARRPQEGWQSVPLIDSLRAPRTRHARRRRTIVIGLLAVATVSLLGAVAGVLPGFLAVFSVLLLGAYGTAMYLQLRPRETPASAGQHHVAQQVADGDGRSVRDGVRVVTGDQSDSNAWEPVATTPPLYATKPKASKVPRRIDLTNSGWTGADMVEQARAQQFDREFAAVEPEVDEEIDELANYRERYYRRAVNE